MSRLISALLAALLSMLFCISSFAKEIENRVFAENILISDESTVTVPIKIQNNTGFMGFMLTVDYDASLLEPVSVSRGEILTGLFNDSVETAQDNSFKIVFSGNANITADGVLTEITFRVLSHEDGSSMIYLAYSQPDTFDENWENVVFNCESISLKIGRGNPLGIEWFVLGELYETTFVLPGENIEPPAVPVVDGYSFDGWEIIPNIMPEEDITIHAVMKKLPEPELSIKNISSLETKKLAYKTTITFTAEVNGVEKDSVVWFVNGEKAGTGEKLTLERVLTDFEIYCIGVKDIRSETAEIEINTGLFARIAAFFRELFNRLPVIEL